MRRYIGIAVGLGLVLVGLTGTNAAPALAQGALKPISAWIVNDRANPVPVTVVAPPAQTTVTCTMNMGGAIDAGAAFITIGLSAPKSGMLCPGGVTSIDVSRISYAVDPSSTRNIDSYRVTVNTPPADGRGSGPVVGIVTNGAPDAAPLRTFRLDSTAPGQIDVFLTAKSGNADNVFVGGQLILVGTPVQ